MKEEFKLVWEGKIGQAAGGDICSEVSEKVKVC